MVLCNITRNGGADQRAYVFAFGCSLADVGGTGGAQRHLQVTNLTWLPLLLGWNDPLNGLFNSPFNGTKSRILWPFSYAYCSILGHFFKSAPGWQSAGLVTPEQKKQFDTGPLGFEFVQSVNGVTGPFA